MSTASHLRGGQGSRRSPRGRARLPNLAETLRLVRAGPVDQQRVEEDGVTLLHLQVHPRVLRVVVAHAVIHFVHAPLEGTELSSVFVRTESQEALVPPIRGSRARAGCPCAFPGGQPGSRSPCSPSPWLSKHRRSCQQAGRESNADPGASGGGTSSCLQKYSNTH